MCARTPSSHWNESSCLRRKVRFLSDLSEPHRERSGQPVAQRHRGHCERVRDDSLRVVRAGQESTIAGDRLHEPVISIQCWPNRSERPAAPGETCRSGAWCRVPATDTMQTIGTQSIRIDGTPMESLEFVKSSLPNSSPSEPIPNDTLCRLVADRLIQIWESWLMFTKMRDHIVAKPVAYIDVHRVGSKMRLFTDDF